MYGDGSVFTRTTSNGNKRYIARIHINGKRTEKTFQKYSLARKWLLEMRSKRSSIMGLDEFEILNFTVEKLGKSVIEGKLNKRIITENTYIDYMSAFKHLKPLYKMEVSRLSYSILDDFLISVADKGYSNRTIKKTAQLLNNILDESIRLGIREDNPMRLIIKPKSQKPDSKYVSFTKDELKKILKILYTFKYKYSEVIILAFLTGFRPAEIVALTVEDIIINEHDKFLSVSKDVSLHVDYSLYVKQTPKTESGNRLMPISDKTYNFLQPYIKGKEPKDLIFSNRKGNIINPTKVSASFKLLLTENGFIDRVKDNEIMSLYSMRHTFLTLLGESSIPLMGQVYLAGHKNPDVLLQRYQHVTPEFLSEQQEKLFEKLKNK